MSEQAWDLTEVDNDTLARAEREAEALGVSLADYLTEILLGARGAHNQSEGDALADYLADTALDDEAEPLRPSSNTLITREFIRGARYDVTQDVGHGPLSLKLQGAEISLTETAQELAHTLRGVAQELGAMSAKLAGAQNTVDGLRAGQDALEIETARRLDAIETALANAGNAVAALTGGHEALKRAAAKELADLSRDTAEGLHAARNASEAAAEHADRVAAQMTRELGELRNTMEDRLAESAAESRARVHAAFKDALDRVSAMSTRLEDVEQRQAGDAHALRIQLFSAEQAAQTALDETAANLSAANAELSDAVTQAIQSQERSLREMRDDIGAEFARTREQRHDHDVRFQLLDAAVTNSIDEIAKARAGLDQRIELAEANAQAGAREARTDALKRHEAIVARLSDVDALISDNDRRALAETHRVELSTLAALENIALTSEQRDAELEARLVAAEASTQALIASIEERLNADSAAARDAQAQTASRLGLLENAIAERPQLKELDARLAQANAAAAARADDIEARAQAELEALRGDHARTLTRVSAAERTLSQLPDSALTERRIAAVEAAATRSARTLDERVAALAARIEAGPSTPELQQRFEDLRSRLTPIEQQAGGNAERLQDVARLLGRLSAQQTEAAAQAADRLHRVELALADVRVDRRETVPPQLEERLGAFEQRHEAALESLRAEIAAFVNENDRRLAQLEQGDITADRDLAGDFETLRLRLEERMREIEHRGVRALEQVADTVSLIEKRMSPAEASANRAG
jgi:hypothetical protein